MATQVKTPSHFAAYMRFLQLATDINCAPLSVALDPNETALLDVLALHWIDGKPMAVREAMDLGDLGSPSTLHRRISGLRTLGLLESQSSPKNQRIKLLVPTKLAISGFAKLGAAVIKAAKVGRQ